MPDIIITAGAINPSDITLSTFTPGAPRDNSVNITLYPAAVLKQWDGNQWSWRSIKYYDGANWLSKPLKVWDGNKWAKRAIIRLK
jgi:hypothetical protein